jgi:hypothetical protein
LWRTLRKTGLANEYALRRHAQSQFHQKAAAAYLSGAQSAGAPDPSTFKRVIDHVCKHSGSAGAGITSLGGGRKVLRILKALATASLERDQEFAKRCKSWCMIRDSRKARLCIRYVMVDNQLNVRRGILGLARGRGSNAESIVSATNFIPGACTTPPTPIAQPTSALFKNCL